jgi:hypothetical protein
MPNFDAVLRTSYRDLDGLVLDCSPADLSPEVWINRAPSYEGQPRFGNPFQDVAAQRPTIGSFNGIQFADFLRSASQHYKVPLVGDFGADSQRWAFAFQGIADLAVVANEQAIFGTSTNKFSILRRGPAGFEGYRHNGALVTGGAVDWTLGNDVFQLLGGNLVDWFNTGVGTLRENNGAFSDIGFTPDVLNSAFIGRDNVGNHYDGVLAAMRIWRRRLSLLEVDFAYQSLAVEGANLSVESRAVVSLAEWLDVTGSGDRQADRLRPSAQGGAQRFWLARGPVGARVQIAAMVGGVTLADADLGGDLFTLTTLEAPVAPPVFQDAGVSAVFDVRLVNEGHYSFHVQRANGGGVVVHVDYEVTS